MAQESTQPLTEMSTKGYLLGVKAAGSWGLQPYHLHVPIVWKFMYPQPPGALNAYPSKG
jgi:hypothetical protein